MVKKDRRSLKRLALQELLVDHQPDRLLDWQIAWPVAA
jgi:hypothetical protein